MLLHNGCLYNVTFSVVLFVEVFVFSVCLELFHFKGELMLIFVFPPLLQNCHRCCTLHILASHTGVL